MDIVDELKLSDTLLTLRAASAIEQLREVLQMWVKFWEADGEDNIFEPLLAEEAMEATRSVL